MTQEGTRPVRLPTSSGARLSALGVIVTLLIAVLGVASPATAKTSKTSKPSSSSSANPGSVNCTASFPRLSRTQKDLQDR